MNPFYLNVYVVKKKFQGKKRKFVKDPKPNESKFQKLFK
jgi:hypothetical protein